MAEGPNDPVTPMAEASGALRELFESMVAQGFTEDQALRFVAYWLACTTKLNNEGDS